MSRRRARSIVRWARYVNRYAHVPGALVGGSAAMRVIFVHAVRRGPYRSVRRQAKHRVAATAPNPSGGDTR